MDSSDGRQGDEDEYTGAGGDAEGLALMASFDSHDRCVQSFITKTELENFADTFHKAALLLRSEDVLANPPNISPAELDALQNEAEHKWRQPWTLYLAILMCSVGAIEQGMAQTSMSGANLYFPAQFGIGSGSTHDTVIVGLINSGIYLSVGFFGAWLADPVNQRIGRRGAIFTGSITCMIFNVASAFSWNWQSLLLFRVLLGAGLGLNAATIVVYAAEVAPAYIRGGLAVSWQMFTAFGIFIGFVVNIAVYNVDSPWRWQLAFPAIPVMPLAIFVWTCPESPAYLIKRGRDYDAAFLSLRRLRNTDLQAAKEVYGSYVQHWSNHATLPSPSLVLKLIELFSVPRLRRASLASFTVMLSQQLCGINIIAFFSSMIFVDSGLSRFQALLASTVFGFVNFLGAFPAVWSMESLGRSLLLLTLPPMAVTMLAAGLTFRMPDESSSRFGLLAVLIYVFCALYSPGMGPVPAPYSGEVYPLSHRELGMSFAVSVANSFAAVLSLTFPRLLAVLQAEGAFELYAVLNILAFVLVFLFVPETKMKNLDELEGVFSTRTRDFIRYNITQFTPLSARRYVVGQKGAQGHGVSDSTAYAPLEQSDREQ